MRESQKYNREIQQSTGRQRYNNLFLRCLSVGLASLFLLGTALWIILTLFNIVRPNLFFYRQVTFSQLWYAPLFLAMCAISIPVVKRGLIVRSLYSVCWWPFFFFFAGNQLVGDEGYYKMFITNTLDKGNDQLTIRIMHKLLFFTDYTDGGITVILACFGVLYVLGLLQLSKKLNPEGPLGSAFFLLQFSSLATLTFFRDFEVYTLATLLSVWLVVVSAGLSPCIRPRSKKHGGRDRSTPGACPPLRLMSGIIIVDWRLLGELLMTVVLCVAVWSNYTILIFLPMYLCVFICAGRWRSLLVQAFFAFCLANLLGFLFSYNPWIKGSLGGAGDKDVFVTLLRSHTPVEYAVFSVAYVKDVLSVFLFISPALPMLVVLAAVFARRNCYSPFTLSAAIPSLVFILFCNFDLGVENDYNLLALGALGVNLFFSEAIGAVSGTSRPIVGKLIASVLVLSNFLLFLNVIYRYTYT